MRAVNGRANTTIRNAFSLAQRGATYSARVEMIEALRMIAEALDMRDGTRQHSDALKRGFVALDEADDFQQRGLAAELNLEVLVAGHQTPVLKEADLSNITPLVGLQKYLTYAQTQLAAAAGEQPTASLALYGLGRLQMDMAEADDAGLPGAIVFHQAAVTTDSMNYKAANELGVLLARYGQYEPARQMLAHSVRVCPQAESWRNLSKIHEQLGENDLARRAIHESQLAARGVAGRNVGVRWVDPAALAGTIETNPGGVPAAQAREVTPPSPSRNVTREGNEGLMRLIPWIRGE
jgi:tetratricopeptide (TPR) repeat protein